MTNLASQKQPDKEKRIDHSTKIVEKENNISSGNKSDMILLTGFAVIIMGILIFLFK